MNTTIRNEKLTSTQLNALIHSNTSEGDKKLLPPQEMTPDAIPAQLTPGYHVAVKFSKLTSSTKISARSAHNIFLLRLPRKWQQ
jgi:hypothetical protein